jgi:hypothetical protein
VLIYEFPARERRGGRRKEDAAGNAAREEKKLTKSLRHGKINFVARGAKAQAASWSLKTEQWKTTCPILLAVSQELIAIS